MATSDTDDDAMGVVTPELAAKDEESVRKTNSPSFSTTKKPQRLPKPATRSVQQIYIAPEWQNPWEAIQASGRSNNPEIHALEGHIMSRKMKQLAALDPTKHNDAKATLILESKVKSEIQFQNVLLATILTVDGRQRDKSYEGILKARVGRYKRRLDRWRWDKLFKPTSDVEGARVEIRQKQGEIPTNYHRRILYSSFVDWLRKVDEYFKSLEKGWTACRYVTEKVLHEVLLWTEELWEERLELERVYCEHEGKPPAFYQSNWSGPLMQSD